MIARAGKRDAVTPVERREYAPMLATPATSLPAGAGWLFEVKWDGYRALAYLRDGEVRLVSRNSTDLTRRFGAIATAIAKTTRSADVVLDGEVCALDETGRPSFSAMQQAKPATSLVYAVFDLLELDGEPLVDLPLRERRRRLERLLDRRSMTVRLSEAFDDGQALFDAAARQGLEGVIAKRAASRYAEGRRTRDWLKVKTHERQELVIAGYTKGQGRRAGHLGALVLAVWGEQGLEYAGNCGMGFSDRDVEELTGRLRKLERASVPFDRAPAMPRVRKGDVVWVEPELVCEVEFKEWTRGRRLRAPSFRGLREDVAAREVRREEAFPSELRKGRRVLRLVNLGKVFWPEEGITKADLFAYYRAIAPVLLPHLKDRPFTMKRYPAGIEGEFFFQKDAPSHMPGWIPTRAFRSTSRETREKRTIRYPLVNDELALLWMVNMGCIDLNTWCSRVDRPERPDWVLFDLDPSPGARFAETVEVALLVKEALDALGLAGFPKTSGGKGIHVLVPLERRHTYADTRELAEIVAGALARTHRGLVTTEWSKAKRRGVLVDASQNGEGKTIASVYSVRPRPGAPVSTPLRWEELDERLDPAAFTMEAVLARVERDGDLFGGVLSTRQRLASALRRLR